MALTLACDTLRTLDIQEYSEHLRARVKFTDVESVLDSASQLRALANDRALVVDRLNTAVEDNFRGKYLKSAQAFVLARGEDFIVRAAIWPPASSVASGRIYQEQFSYDIAHDHNFSFLTVNYLGPGYDTDIFEYDYDKVVGYVGEPIDLRFLERKHFGAGSVMYYRPNRDVHIQRPPPDLTITLNLVWWPESVRFHEQFVFDVDRKVIAGHTGDGDADRRLSLLTMAGLLGDDETRGLLADLAASHPCRRTRLAAYRSLATLSSPNGLEDVWNRASMDPDPLVKRVAREQLDRLAA